MGSPSAVLQISNDMNGGDTREGKLMHASIVINLSHKCQPAKSMKGHINTIQAKSNVSAGFARRKLVARRVLCSVL